MIFALIVNIIVILGIAYLSFIMALAGWIAALKRGEALTIINTKDDGQRGMAAHMAMAVFALIVTVFLCIWLWMPLPFAPGAESRVIYKTVGLVLFLIGLLLIMWARHTLGRMWGISTSWEAKLLPDHQLVDRGLYAVVRHPMYFGWWVSMLALLLIYWTWIVLIFFLLSLFVFYKRARREEAILAEYFGAQWKAYVDRTRFLIPWVF